MEIIRRRERVEVTQRYHSYSWDRPHSGHGFVFDVDEAGAIIVTEGCALNVTRCLLGFDPDSGDLIYDDGTDTRTWDYVEPALGRCDCGEEVQLEHFTNTCDGCGADYNSSGQHLAPRSQMG